MKIQITLLLLVSWLAEIGEYFETYIYEDWGFLKFLLVLVVVDTLLGLYRAIRQKNLSSKAWGMVLDKVISYTSILIMIHVLSFFTVGGKVVEAFTWIKVIAYSMLMVKEGISILENVGAINSRLVPKWILKKLKEFDEEGKFVLGKVGTTSDKTSDKTEDNKKQ